MTLYLPRSAWTSTAAAGVTLTGDRLLGVAVHWPGTTSDTIGDPGQAGIAERLRHYRDYHVNTRGWSDIGYNLAIDQAGRVWMLRTTSWRGNRVGAHCASASNPDANREYVGVLLLLGDREPPTPAMIGAFVHWRRNHFLTGWPGRGDLRGHGDVAGAQTACPGPYARAALPQLADKVPAPPPPSEDDVSNTQTELIAAARIAVHGLLREAAAAVTGAPEATPTGRQVRTYLHAIIDPETVSEEELAEALAPPTP